MTDNEFDRTARAWLEDGPNVMSDRALRFALDEIHATRQHRAWWPARRFSSMGSTIRLAAGVAVLVLATVVGINLLPGRGPGGPTPTPSPSVTPTPRALIVDSVGWPSLEPGTYVTPDPFLLRVTFTVPVGWKGKVGGPNAVFLSLANGRGELAFSIFEKVYADPCNYQGLLDPLPGPSVDDLAAALASLPGLNATTPTDVTLGGYQGKQLTFTAPSSFDRCTLSPDGRFRVWELPLGATLDMFPGERDRLWILNVDGKRLVILAAEIPGQTAEARAEVQGILDSIRIAPANSPTSSPS